MDSETLLQPVVEQNPTAVFETIRESGATCSWCFGRVRTFYPDYDAAREEAMADRKLGGVEANSLISNETAADPHASREVVPAMTDGGGIVTEPPQLRTVCECGVIDHRSEDERTKSQLLDAAQNIGHHLHQEYVPFDVAAAETVVDKAAAKGLLGGRDMAILKRATILGLTMGPKRAIQARHQ